MSDWVSEEDRLREENRKLREAALIFARAYQDQQKGRADALKQLQAIHDNLTKALEEDDDDAQPAKPTIAGCAIILLVAIALVLIFLC